MIGESSMIRVSLIVSSVVTTSKPGTRYGTITGAKIDIRIEPVRSATSIRLMTLDATRHARSRSPWWSSAARTGTSAEASAPAAASW